ncbi:hypothetical protein DPMN_123720 [Dreissena polymorpha]|uniref:RING-type domain-containing protein n=1 Tax=Dreissena polymorpha TaxID=45954 RepID=A0A9D4GS52_DREPO|nr:hypothetical protein DPMN_123720 [Dreissena polymorpha]
MDRCPLCFGTFQKPKLLPCLDTMCFTRLDEYVLKHARASGTFPCPVWGLELPVPDGGVSKFDDNQHIKVEQTLERALAAPGGHVPCETRMRERPFGVLLKKLLLYIFIYL